ncbi:MAG TPA: ABC transporter, partial [Phytomonospora sp.]
TPGELKRLVPGGHVLLRFDDPAELTAAIRLLPGAVADEEDLTLRVDDDGRVRSMRLLLERIDDAGLDVGDLTVHRPDLDDVFLALTGRPRTGKEAVR